MTIRPQLIAHRGYSACYPENTLLGIEAALRVGASYFEFDVQFTADAVPVVFHDHELRRITGMGGYVHELTVAELSAFHAAEPGRFGDRFGNEPIPTLADMLQLLRRWPQAIAFVEIKEHAVKQFGAEIVARRMVSALAPFGERCVLISFDAPVLAVARAAGLQRIGWVLHHYSRDAQRKACELAPEWLFCDYKKVPDRDGALWSGPWQWALYDIIDPGLTLHWTRRGADFIETWDIGALLNPERADGR
jgi:glycerophosphoryl diester phosphodiesterase